MIIKFMKAGAMKGFGELGRYLTDQAERVGFTETRNLAFSDTESVASEMRQTAHANPNVKKPVQHIIVSFHPDDKPTDEMLREVGDRILKHMGLDEHQVLLASHTDRGHTHLHMMVNRVHPETFKTWHNGNSFYKARSIARTLEEEYGLVQTKRVASQKDLSRGELALAAKEERIAFVEHVRSVAGESFRGAKSWTQLERRLAEVGLRLERKGQGFVVTDGISQVKASRIGRNFSKQRLETRLGPYPGPKAAISIDSEGVWKTNAQLGAPNKARDDLNAAGSSFQGLAMQGIAQIEGLSRSAGLTPADIEQSETLLISKQVVQRLWSRMNRRMQKELSPASHAAFKTAVKHARGIQNVQRRGHERSMIDRLLRSFDATGARKEAAGQVFAKAHDRLARTIHSTYRNPDQVMKRFGNAITEVGPVRASRALYTNPKSLSQIRAGASTDKLVRDGRSFASAQIEAIRAERAVRSAEKASAYYRSRSSLLSAKSQRDGVRTAQLKRKMAAGLKSMSKQERRTITIHLRGFQQDVMKDAATGIRSAKAAKNVAGGASAGAALSAGATAASRTAGATVRGVKSLLGPGRMPGAAAIPLSLPRPFYQTCHEPFKK